ncbi:MAG: MaoC family dehydratase [Desulfarculaceae bacterium]|nr:MaoC family dehydratase [Desulfarculaceae bacterium]
MSQVNSIDRLSVGQIYETTLTVDEKRIAAFAEATGDDNPIHFDDEAAAKSIFGRRVAQGMLTAGFISGVFGTQFPGSGTIYMSQSVRFQRPVFIGDDITVRLEVLEMWPEKNRIRVATTCLNQEGQEVLSGEAMVMPPPKDA